MNKQRYLAELSRLLGFATEEDRRTVLNNITRLFDEAGPDGEAGVISQLGTPVQLAIKLSRSYTPSEPSANVEEAPMASQISEENAESPRPVEEAPATEEVESDNDDSPEPTVSPDESSDTAPSDAESGEIPAEPIVPVQAVKVRKDRSEHRGFAMASLIMLTVAGIIPLCAVLLCAVLAALGAGLVGIVSGIILVSAGTTTLAIIADALMLFGIALACFGIGILLVWFAIWAAISLVRVLVLGIPALYGYVKGATEK